MSQPVSRLLHPFDIARRPGLEPEVQRAILSRWASGRAGAAGKPGLRKPRHAERAVPVDDLPLAPLDSREETDKATRQ